MANAVIDQQINHQIDAITSEVIRHKLQAIVEEQAITLKAVSGSPVVAEATDFNCGLYLDDGSIVIMGPQVLFHSGTMSTVIKGIIELCSENPGINEGDMFILNDPYRGAIHQPDVSIVAPVFHEGKRIAWVGACAHQLDVGGMSFGSWAYGATHIQQEAMLIPGLKIVEKGEVRHDIWTMIMGMTRLPQVIGLDLKAMIAANNVALRRFDELTEKYGIQTVVGVMGNELNIAEQQLRDRLKKIPDGTYRARDYLDHDGHSNTIYDVCVSVEKKGDSLTFNMAGTSPQAPGFINCTYSGMRGAIFAGLLPILTPDIRWNEGLMRTVNIKAEPGTLSNAQWPAPVSGGTVSAAWVVTNVTVAAISRMVSTTKELSCEAKGVTKGQFSVLTLAGQDRDGGPYGTFFMDSMAGGGGAYLDHDGLDGSGDYVVPRPTIANVEANEAAGPILYLYRSLIPDTGGAGRFRGGNTAGIAVTPHDADVLHAMVLGHGVEVPNSTGLFGGLPGGCAAHLVQRKAGASVSEILNKIWSPEVLKSAAEDIGAKPGAFELLKGDIVGYYFQGGGGYGDPLTRDPAHVLEDVNQQRITVESAKKLYGVIIEDSHVDYELTNKERCDLRYSRLGSSPQSKSSEISVNSIPELQIHSDKSIACMCGQNLATPGENWKANTVARELQPANIGVYVRLHTDLSIKAYSCPNCGTQLEVEILRTDQPPLVSIELAP